MEESLAPVGIWFYAVIELESGEFCYSGQNLDKVADALNPGTTYARGLTWEEARLNAKQARFDLETAAALEYNRRHIKPTDERGR